MALGRDAVRQRLAGEDRPLKQACLEDPAIDRMFYGNLSAFKCAANKDEIIMPRANRYFRFRRKPSVLDYDLHKLLQAGRLGQPVIRKLHPYGNHGLPIHSHVST